MTRNANPRFDLEKAIAMWRRRFEHDRSFRPEDIRELEQHVRDQTLGLVAHGYSEKDAFVRTMQEMGEYEEVRTAYRDVLWGKIKREHTVADHLLSRLAMLKHFFKIALRSLRKQKGFSFINITGLAVGLTCSFFILFWVQHELSYDRFLKDGDRIHQVLRNVRIGGEVFTWRSTSKPLADVLETEYPAISKAVISLGWRFVVTSGGESFREDGSYASAAFFDVFAFPFIRGDPATALQGESSIVITDRTARKLFGDDWQKLGGALGKQLTIDHRKDFTITGVIEDIPDNSSFQADVVVPALDLFARNEWVDTWGNNAFPLYVKLEPGVSPTTVSEQIAGVVNANEEGADESLFLQPYEDLYLHSDYEDGRLVGGRIEYVRILSVVAVFLLLIAAINFMNLATARSARRAREIGVRKAIGAHQRSLIGQFLGESTLVALIAFAVSVPLVLLLLPSFNHMTDKHFVIADLGGPVFFAGLAISLTVGLMSGSYPALYLSSFSPLAALRGTFRQRPSTAALRKGLVVFQFCLSVLLIAATVAVYLQIDYIRNRDLGLERENVIKLAQEGALKSQYDAVRQELLQRPGIAGVTAANTSPLSVGQSTSEVTWDGKDPDAEYEVAVLSANYDFIETMKMEVIAGRSFTREHGAANPGYVINEELARIIGSSDVPGTQISFWDQTGPVIGIVKDFEMNSIYAPTEPLIMQLAPQNTNRFFVRTRPGETGEALASLEEVFEQFNPDYPFDYRFLDEEFEAAYRSEVVIGRLANVFAVIAIFISCLGLFGLVSFTVQHRTKEIGVRKVLGASVTNLTMLLTGETTRLVLLGIVLALPIAYFVVQEWLTRFADHVDIGAGLFVAAGVLAMVVAWTTVSFHTIKAALADPVKSLRYE